MIICAVSWCSCDGVPSNHDIEACAIIMVRVGEKIKRIPICQEHLETLKKGVLHHDPKCEHPSLYASEWSIEKLETEK